MDLTGAQARGAPALIKEEFVRVPARGEHPQAYIECGMQTASQRHGYDGAEYCAAQREIGRLRRLVIEIVKRMQRAHGEFGKGRVN